MRVIFAGFRNSLFIKFGVLLFEINDIVFEKRTYVIVQFSLTAFLLP